MRRVIVVLVTAALTVTAAADSDTAKRAEGLFEEGKAASAVGDFATACDKFTKSLELDPTQLGVQLNLGDCMDRSARYLKAVEIFETVARELEKKKDSRAKFAHDRAAAATAKLAIVVVRIPDPIPAGTTVKLGDRAVVPVHEIHEHADPGDLIVVVAAPDHQRFERKEKLASGATTTIDVVLPTIQRPQPVLEPMPQPVAAPGERRRSRVHLAWGLAGGGVVALTTTTVLAVVAKHQYNDVVTGPDCMQHPLVCTPAGSTGIAHAQSLANVGTGFAVVGIALVAGAGVVYYTAPREGLVVAPTASATSVGVLVGRTF